MKKTVKIILIALAAVILVAAGVIVAFYIRVNDPSNVFSDTASAAATPAPTPTLSAGTAAPEATDEGWASVEAEETPGEDILTEDELISMSDTSFMKDRVNILVLGIDRSVERLASDSFRSDTIILVSVNFATLDVDMISVPRDSYVKLYSKNGNLIDSASPYNKVNSAFSLGGGVDKGGYKSEMNTVSAMMGGIPISYYVGFDMNAVKLIVDAMGGVDYEVDIEVTMNGRELHPGLQHLDGQAVLDYCRQRKGSSDIARADRQQRMLTAIFTEMKSSGQIANIPEIYKAVSDSIDTDLSFEQICSLALMAVRMDYDQLDRHTVEGTAADIYSRSCWLVNNSKLVSLIKDVFGVTVEPDPDMDSAAVLARVDANSADLADELASANAVYSESTAFLANYKNSLSADTIAAIKDARTELATYIRTEVGDYLVYYTALLSSELDAAYAELGAERAPSSAGSAAGSEDASGEGEVLTGYDAVLAAGDDD